MRLLNSDEVMEVSGSGWLKFALPIVVGFAIGGPAGAVYAAGTIVATAGATNLEHLYAHDKIPTIHDTVNA